METVNDMAFENLEEIINNFKDRYAYWDERQEQKSQLLKTVGEAVCGGGECGAGGCSTSCSGSGCGWD